MNQKIKRFISFLILLAIMYLIYRPDIERIVGEAWKKSKRSHWTEWLGM